MTSQASPDITQQDETEPELLVRARSGDTSAFAVLYNDHRESVFRFILSRVRNRHLAEDLTQDVFVRALRRFAEYVWVGRDIAAWLLTIARNLVIDHFRLHRTKREVTTGEIFALDSATPGPEETVVNPSAAHDQITHLMDRLCPRQKECIGLRFLKELSVPETAAVMGCTEGAVKLTTHRAMKSMRQHVGQVAA